MKKLPIFRRIANGGPSADHVYFMRGHDRWILPVLSAITAVATALTLCTDWGRTPPFFFLTASLALLSFRFAIWATWVWAKRQRTGQTQSTPETLWAVNVGSAGLALSSFYLFLLQIILTKLFRPSGGTPLLARLLDFADGSDVLDTLAKSFMLLLSAAIFLYLPVLIYCWLRESFLVFHWYRRRGSLTAHFDRTTYQPGNLLTLRLTEENPPNNGPRLHHIYLQHVREYYVTSDDEDGTQTIEREVSTVWSARVSFDDAKQGIQIPLPPDAAPNHRRFFQYWQIVVMGTFRPLPGRFVVPVTGS